MTAQTQARALAASSYLEEDIRTADPVRLIVHALELAVRHAARARAALAANDPAHKGQAIARLCGCLGVLQGALDMERGGEIARNLDRLYSYLLVRVCEGHLRNDAAAFEEVSRHLDEMAGAWREAARQRAEDPLLVTAGAR